MRAVFVKSSSVMEISSSEIAIEGLLNTGSCSALERSSFSDADRIVLSR